MAMLQLVEEEIPIDSSFSSLSTLYGVNYTQGVLLSDDQTCLFLGGIAYDRHRNDEICNFIFACKFDKTIRWIKNMDVIGGFPSCIGHSVNLINEKIYVFGGEPCAEINHFPPQYSSLRQLTMAKHCVTVEEVVYEGDTIVPSNRAWHATAVIQKNESSCLLVYGGKNGTDYLDDLWLLAFDDTSQPPWEELKPDGNGPQGLAYHTVTYVDNMNQVILLGGYSTDGPNTSVYIYDINENCWSTLQDISLNVLWHLTLPVSWPYEMGRQQSEEKEDTQFLLIFGGRSINNENGWFSLSLLRLDKPELKVIDSHFISKECIIGHCAVVSKDKNVVYCFGGVDDRKRPRNKVMILRNNEGCIEEEGKKTADEDVPLKDFIVLPNGDAYKGSMDISETYREGHGVCQYANSDKYEGEWFNDMRTGNGVYTWSNGDIYKGNFVHGMREGIGEIGYAQGELLSYKGEWLKDNKYGVGTAMYRDGLIYEGEWKDDQPNGNGRLTKFEEEKGIYIDYEGEIMDGYPCGKGNSITIGYPKTGYKYSGEWKSGKRHGNGESTSYDGNVYIGAWKNGKRNGIGKCYYGREKSCYEGKWVGDKRAGKGIQTYANGEIYDGQWQNDKREGFGRYQYKDGSFYEGEWKDDQKTGDGAFRLDITDDSPSTE